MNDNFYYIGNDTLKIEDKSYICLYILDLQTKTIHKIYKLNNSSLQDLLSNTDYFSEVTALIRFVIKRDGKISLDIVF